MIENMEPGKYRTRDGRLAIVSSPAGTSLNYWVGRVDNDVEMWRRHGQFYGTDGDESPLDLVARIPDETPADDRIERALQLLRDAQTWELHSGHRSGPVMNAVPRGGEWAEAETLDEVRKILEGEDNDH